MLETLNKLFTEQLKLSADLWSIILLIIPIVAFVVALVVGLCCGKFKTVKSVMRTSVAKPQTAIAAMKSLPASIKAQYKNARLGNLKPSMLVTESVCVDEPYRHSLISKVWLVTFVSTIVCAFAAFFATPLAAVNAEDEAAALNAVLGVYSTPLTILLLGGLLTLVGGIVGKCALGGAAKLYDKFVLVLDGGAEQQAPAYSAPQQTFAAEPQQAYAAEPQQAYAEPQTAYAEPQQAYAEPQQVYAEPQQVYAEPTPVVQAVQQESDEEIRRRAREEALARARAEQQAAQAQAQAQAQQQAAQQAQAASQGGSSSVDEVIARIEQIDREGAPRETMREVATMLQKERAKPENKTPECQKRLNDALSKLLKAMSAASRK